MMSAIRYSAVLFFLVILFTGRVESQVQTSRGDPQSELARAEKYFNLGDFSSTVYVLDGILQNDPQNVEALTLLGQVYFAAQQLQEAERFFRRAIKASAKSPAANLGLSLILLFTDKVDSARAYAMAALQEESTRTDALNVLGQIALTQGQLETAREYFEQLLARDNTHFDALNNLGALYQKLGDTDKALSYLQKAAELYPNAPSVYNNLGVFYYETGRLHEAIIALNTAAVQDSLATQPLRTLGMIFLERGLLSEAITTFQRALERDVLDTESRVGKALAYWSLQDYDNALKEINMITAMGLRFNRMELLLATIYLQKKQYDQAIEYAKKDEKQNGEQAEGHYLLGILYQLQDEQEKAVQEFEEVAALMKQNPDKPMSFDLGSFLSF